MDAAKTLVKERASRVRILRGMTNLTIKSFSAEAGVSVRALKNWESGSLAGLTDKAAEKLSLAAERCGIHASNLWLMYGSGAQPIMLGEIYNKADVVNEPPVAYGSRFQISAAIKKEMKFFKRLNPGAVTMQILDDSMEPYYRIGDLVCGIRKMGAEVIHALNQDCIIETAGEVALCRRITKGAQEGRYNLSCINPNTTVEPSIVSDVEVFSAAPIILIRRLG
ncbi:MAG: hypothetical protein KAT71_02625 [Gammaproteobacteria bacterium]|nr:hypothetical protein [Gammaproteobacteria bacterium]